MPSLFSKSSKTSSSASDKSTKPSDYAATGDYASLYSNDATDGQAQKKSKASTSSGSHDLNNIVKLAGNGALSRV